MPATETLAAAPADSASSLTASPSAGGNPEPAGGSAFDFAGELDKLAGVEMEKPNPAQETKPDPAKVPTAKEPKIEKPDPKPDPAKPESEKFGKVSDLRKAYEDSKKRAADLEREVSELKTAKPKAEDPELPKVKETLAEREKRLSELENEIRLTNYEKSQEYREQYQKPMELAFASAFSDVKELTVVGENGVERPGTEDDFQQLLKMPLADASKKANEMFGYASGEVLAHRRKLIELNKSRQEALVKFQKEVGERETKAREEHAKRVEGVLKIWDDSNKEIVEKYPQWFAPEEKDLDGNKLLTDGFQLADLAFKGHGTVAPEMLAKIQSEVRTRAAGFGRLAQRNEKLTAQVAALEKRIAEFEKSGPGGEDPALKPGGKVLSYADEIDALAGIR